MIDNFIQTIYKSSRWFKLVIIFVIIILLYFYYNKKTNIEGFVQNEKFIIKYNDQIYDNFFSSIYKKLNYDILKNEYEVGSIVNSTKPTSKSLILEIIY